MDLYRFDIPAESALPKLLTVSAAGSASLDGYLRLFDAAGLEVANNDDNAYPDLDPLLRTYLLEELGVEGRQSNQWVLMDYGDVVVHIFYEPVRFHYDLEGLWIEAPRINPPEAKG